MADPRFVTNAQGERVGVLLDLSTYEQMLAGRDDPELLLDLSEPELAALAEGELALGSQQDLHILREKSGAHALSEDEAERLDRLIERIDQLNVLKARARYTLRARSQTQAHAARE